jgi:nucleoside-diphosphate-sugar epimerase
VPSAFVTGGSGFIGGRLLERLRRDGHRVRALARSDAAAEKVAAGGAEPVPGEITDPEAIRAGAEGCELAFHLAAKVEDWGPWAEFERHTVDGTRHALQACAAAGVRRFTHVGSEAALMAGQPLVGVDESAPLRPDSRAPYPRSKAIAEQSVRTANRDGFETVVLRPRFVWGRGDTSLLPGIMGMVEAGRFAWIGGGGQLTATTHVENTVEGMMLASERGRPGEAYFVTDGEPVVFRDFVSDLIRTQGVEPPRRSIPTPVAGAVMRAGEALWRLPLPGRPPVTRFAYWVSSQECTIEISKARRELGYEPVISRSLGLAEMTEGARDSASGAGG